MKKYSLGLDLGIASVGWSIFELNDENDNFTPIRMIDCGIRIFDALESPKDGITKNSERRANRGLRRIVRRRKHRILRTKYLITKYFGINDFSFLNNNNPIELKVKGLKEKLTANELFSCLIHYVKNRGFKSNRTKIKEKDEDSKKLKGGIDANRKELETRNMSISEYLSFKAKDIGRYHNRESDFSFSVDRKMYLQEINTLLDKQINFGTINNDFKMEFLKIWQEQRHFSDGPGEAIKEVLSLDGTIIKEKVPSPYAFSIDSMLGHCTFYAEEKRAPRNAPSMEFIVTLGKLQNLRYKINTQDDYQPLSNEVVLKIFEKAKATKKITYKTIMKELELPSMYIKGLEFTKKQYLDRLNKYKNDNKIIKELSLEQTKDFKKQLQEDILDQSFIEMSTYHIMKKVFSEFKSMDIEQLDEIANILLCYKTDDKIIQELNSSKKFKYNSRLIEEILTLDGLSETASVSFKYIYQVLPLMLEGKTQSEAEWLLNLHQPKLEDSFDYLPPIIDIQEKLHLSMTNKNVIHTLSEVRKVINALIKKYGMPSNINVELGRDLAKTFEERKKIRYNQQDNKLENEKTKVEIAKEFNFNLNLIKTDDIVKYRLYKEQKGYCLYSLQHISREDLFTNTEIDHIIPQSKSFDDKFSNKVLVYKKYNQEKGNRTPFQYFGHDKSKWLKFINFIDELNISRDKKDNLLTKEVNEEDFQAKNLHDTQYASRVLTKILNEYLKIPVNCYNGALTAKLRAIWGLNGVTHSLETHDKDYKKNTMYILEVFEIIKEGFLFTFINEITRNALKLEFKKAKQKENQEIDKDSKSIEYLLNHSTVIIDIFNKFIGKKIQSSLKTDEIYEGILERFENNDITLLEHLLNLHSLVRGKIVLESESKNRDNHLHHAIDASILAVMNKSLEQRITKFYKVLEVLGRTKSNSIDPITNEVISNEEFLNLHGNLKFPMPYDQYAKEVKYRILERDEKTMKEKLKYIGYLEEEIDEVSVIYPSFASTRKVNKRMHQDTFYGKANGNSTKRISVMNLKEEDIDKVIDNSDNKIVITSLKKWFQQGDKNTLPNIILKNGNNRVIRKVKVIEGDLNNKVEIGNGLNSRYVANENVIRIDIFTKEGSDNLFFVQHNALTIARERKYKENPINDFPLKIWWGTADNYETSSYKEICNNYINQYFIFKGDLVKITTKNGEGLVIVIGFSSGMLEVESVLGDNFDTVYKYQLTNSFERIKLSISTIRKIKKINMDCLGKL